MSKKDDEKVLNTFVQKWLLIGAKAILTILLGGLLTFFATLNQTVINLKAEAMVESVKISQNKERISDLKTDIKDNKKLLIEILKKLPKK